MSRSVAVSTSSRLYSTAGTWGSAQIVATQRNVVLDLEGRNYDVSGNLHRDHAFVNLPLETAIRLNVLLGEAIEAALDAPANRQAPLWSDATVCDIAEGRGRRFG